MAQVAAAKFLNPGDFRAVITVTRLLCLQRALQNTEQYFAQLYSDPDINNDPFSAGRQMNAHFVTKNTDENGRNGCCWPSIKNTSSDMAPTAGQMLRSLGFATMASKLFRNVDELKGFTELSTNGNEICFCTIGDASTSEGHFWETVNARRVLQVPLAIFV